MHGIVAVDKARGLSSNKATRIVAGAFGRKVPAGHAGTLDPLATGLLVVAVGSATRFLPFLPSGKVYLLECEFGLRTSTYDEEGDVLERNDVPGDLFERVRELLPRHIGAIEQKAPAYSALKHQGRPLHYYARKGMEVPEKIRCVQINDIKVVGESGRRMTFEVDCGPGVYMRSLAASFGDEVGCGAIAAGIRRIRCCGIDVEEALPVDAETDRGERIVAALRPADSLLGHLPTVSLSAEQVGHLVRGRPVEIAGLPAGPLRLHSPAGDAIGIGEAEGDLLRSRRLLPAEQIEPQAAAVA